MTPTPPPPPPTAVRSPTPTRLPTATPGAPATVSHSVLLLFVSQASGPSRLEGAWVIRWLPEASDAYVFAAPHDLWVDFDGSPGRLEDAFTRAGEEGGLQLIRNAVGREVARETLDDIVIVDEQCLGTLDTRLGGLDVEGLAPGSAPWAAVQRGPGSVETLQRHQRLLEALVAALRVSKPDEIALAWYGMAADHHHTTMSYEHFAAFVETLAADPHQQELFFVPIDVYQPFVAPDGLPATRRTANQPP